MQFLSESNIYSILGLNWVCMDICQSDVSGRSESLIMLSHEWLIYLL